MNVPALVQSALGDEDVAAHVPLKGEDALFVTPTRTIIYKADGLLSDETVDEFPHDAEGIQVSEGRRKAKITLDYGLDGEETFSVPPGKLDDVLHPIIAGVLNAAGVTQAGETVKRTYRFSELTLVVTSDRVVRHIGEATWGPDYEEIAFDAVTGIDVEDGNVASQLVLETTGRTQRIKAPNEEFRDVHETVEEAVYAFHDAASAEEFERMNVDEDAESETEDVSFGGGVDPIDTSGVGEDDETEPTAETTAPEGAQAQTTEQPAEQSASGAESRDAGEGDEFESSGFETAASKVEPPIAPEDLEAELDEMEGVVAEMAETIESQREVLEAQQTVLEAQEERLAELREQTVLEAQEERLAELRDLIPDQ